MREKIVVWLLPAEGGERELLGRKVADYAPRALRAFETRYAGSVGEIRAGEGIDVVLPLDMPLVTEEDILRAAATVEIANDGTPQQLQARIRELLQTLRKEEHG